VTGARSRGRWTRKELAILARLTDPAGIQRFLDTLPYSADETYRCPRSVLRDRTAHCFDGALFAAAALRRLGHPPLLVDMRAVRDDDHITAIFRRAGYIGAVAKSNVVGLRYREPIFRTVRELALSYFDDYFNLDGEKSLRSYSTPLDLSRFDALSWETSDSGLNLIAARLDAVRHFPLLTSRQERALSKVDERSYRAGLLGANWAGLYKPRRQGRSRGPGFR
jgi:hypothetical protein